MKIFVQSLLVFASYVACVHVSLAQRSALNPKNFVFENAVEFLHMHTGIAIDQFDEMSFKYHPNATINGVRMSGMYVSTKANSEGVLYDFFIRTDNAEQVGAYTAFYVAGCVVPRASGLVSFSSDGTECTCKAKNSRNFTLKARDINALFTK